MLIRGRNTQVTGGNLSLVAGGADVPLFGTSATNSTGEHDLAHKAYVEYSKRQTFFTATAGFDTRAFQL